MKTFGNNTQTHKHPQHAGGGGGYNLPKKLALSISLIAAAALDLSAMIDISNFDIPENPVERLQLDSNKNNKTTIKQHKVGLSPTSLENRSVNSQLVWAPSERLTRFYYTSLAFVYNDKFTGSQSFRYTTGSQIGALIVDIDAKDTPKVKSRLDGNRQVGTSTSTYNNSDLTITELHIKNDTKFKFNPSGGNKVGTIEHTALNLELGTYNRQSNTIAVGTLNQRSGTTDITSSGVSIDNTGIYKMAHLPNDRQSSKSHLKRYRQSRA